MTPPNNGDVADADDYNSEQNDVASALSDSINKAGTKAFAANQPMGGFVLTGLGAGSAVGHSVRYEQVLPSVFQPLDATLTALAALSWASGNALVQFTAADTVSLTLTPSVSSITASQGAANTTPSGTFVNTTDNAAVRVVRFESDRATPTLNDTHYVSHYMSNGSGTQVEFARVTILATGITAGSESAQYRWGIQTGAGSLADQLFFQNALFGPTTNDGVTLGAGALGFADLFLAEGGTINWDNGDAILTQTGNVVELTGAGMAAPLVQVGSVSGVTLDAATHRNRQLLLTGNITLNDGVFAAGDWHVFTCDGTNRTITRDTGLTMRINGVDSATGTLAANQTASAVWVTASEVHLIGSGIS